MNELIGKTIHYIYRDDTKSFVAFITNANEYYLYKTFGECCLECWFEDILNPGNMIGSKVLKVIEKESFSYKDETEDEEYTCMGYTITTAKGFTDIEFRSDTSTYYSGSCSRIYNKIIVPRYSTFNKIHKNMSCIDICDRTIDLSDYVLENKQSIYITDQNNRHGWFELIELKPVKETNG